MPYIPHTDDEWRAMLAAIGLDDPEALFAEIPTAIRLQKALDLPPSLNELAIDRLLRSRAAPGEGWLRFLGAGAYEHHIPAVVWEIASRGEFLTAYTPYQAEASQGTLQTLYEFQSMMAALTGMDAANASMYDGASALAEAVLLALRANPGRRRVLVPSTVHPRYRQVLRTMLTGQGIEPVELPYCTEEGGIVLASLAGHGGKDLAALVIPQPNFFGCLEETDLLTDWAHDQGALVIGLVNPVALGCLQPPGQWGRPGGGGADVACGEGQPLGAPLAGGGPYFGFLCCREALVRQLPGRIVGRTRERGDLTGATPPRSGFVLTLQAREQHIRRTRATSNICTNQGLLAIAATIHMAVLGPQGVARIATACHQRTEELAQRLTAIPGVRRLFARPGFHEMVIQLPRPAAAIHRELLQHRIVAGWPIGRAYPELGDCLLLCATETKTEADLDLFAHALRESLAC